MGVAVCDNLLAMRFVAHRGLHVVHPENSLAAFAAAWKSDFEWCECDVHFCAGGAPVVIHDATLDRVTGRAGVVAEMKVEDVAEYRLAGTDERVPTLAELLRIMPARGKLMIEVKPEKVTRVFLDVMRTVEPGRVEVQSFHAGVLHQMTHLAFPLALLVDDIA